MAHNLYIGAGVVLLFGAAIFVHEFGHYWMALRRGLKVEAFAIGFGPKMFAWTRNGIEYSVRWIPAGGFVKLPQMVTGPMEGDMKSENVLPAAPFSKILVAVAGPAMNVLFAFAIAELIFFIGLPVLVNPPIIGNVAATSPEAKMGIKSGDRIVAVDGRSVRSWDDVYRVTILAITNVLPVAVQRDGITNTYQLHAEMNPVLGLKMLNLEALDHLIIGESRPGSPAEAAHLQPGDEIIGFAGTPITSYEQLTNLVEKRSDQQTAIVVKRKNATLSLSVKPAFDKDSKRTLLGVQFRPSADAFVIEHPTALSQVGDVLNQIRDTVSALAHSHESGVKASDLSGPVGIIGVLAAEVKTDFRRALSFLVLLNINLAIINMLPVPVLDGGHIMMALIERVRRRPLGLRFIEYINTGFAFLLISFMLYVTFYDIRRLPVFRAVFNRDTQIEQSTDKTPAAAPPSTNAVP